MQHIMNLNPSPFAMVKDGRKTIELRLYDEKRRKLCIGDTILFVNTADSAERIRVRVSAMYLYDSFESLYKELPLLECGYTESDVCKADPLDMEQYYSAEEQERYGVVGIKICLI